MNAKEQEFLKRLRVIFRTEAEDHIRSISVGLVELETATDPLLEADIVEKIFREVHSLKGAARSVDLKDIEMICQPLESVMSALKYQTITCSPALADLLLKAVDCLSHLVATMEVDSSVSDREALRSLSHRLAGAAQKGDPSQIDKPARIDDPVQMGDPIPMSESVRIPITRLNLLLLQAEGMIQAKLSADRRAAEIREIRQMLDLWKAESDAWQGRGLLHPNRMPEWAVSRLAALTGRMDDISHAFEQDQRTLRHMVDDHLEEMKQVLMLPISTLSEAFPRMVRDLARNQGKEVDLIMRGTEMEMDKRILDELKDPLIHLLRNCIDHGIERPDVRAQHQKPGRGTITLSFGTKDNRQVEIHVSDDGMGIDREQIRTSAVKAGIIPAGNVETRSPQETLELIFHSGISTTKIITGISGRGLGLAIVREKVQQLGGQVFVDSRPNEGALFRLTVPLRVTTLRGVLVNAGRQVFVVPASHVDRVMRINRKDVKTVENRETILWDGQILSKARLGDILNLHEQGDNSRRQQPEAEAGADAFISILIVASAGKRIALEVDEIQSEEEVLVKLFGRQLTHVRNCSGATVLGNGKVVLILNVDELIHSAMHSGTMAMSSATTEKKPERTGRILVAEDSITSRTLIKNILEIAGYQVTTAMDGVEAFSHLSAGEFDLLVSDVDMPRLSGFDLTAKIRGDKNLDKLPIVLVTSLETIQDRERGIEVGANAYVIKSSFDQSNLLEVIGRFL